MRYECSLKTWSLFQIFSYKKKLWKSWNENRKGFAILRLCTIFSGGRSFGKSLKQNISLFSFQTSTGNEFSFCTLQIAKRNLLTVN